MKLIVQSDDYGFTPAVTYATHEAIRDGIIRNTGLFANMPAASLAVQLIQDCPDVCLGIDINLVSGCPCADQSQIPALIDHESGEFIRSTVRKADSRWMKEDLYPYNEVKIETQAQIERFISLTHGRKPAYIHGHSIGESSANYRQALHDVGLQYGIPFTRDIWAALGVVRTRNQLKKTMLEQLEYSSEEDILAQLEHLTDQTYVRIGGHCGYVDAQLFAYSTCTLSRIQDYQMYTSPKIKKFINDHQIELVRYNEIYSL